MTKPVDRPYLPRGKTPLQPPAGAAERIQSLAATGHSMVGIARGLGVSKDVLARWLDDEPAFAEALARGRASEEFALHNTLYSIAVDAKEAARDRAICAMFLLKARHGYREGDQGVAANRVSITFQLPGALTPEQFTIDHAPKTDDLPAPGKGLTGS